MAGIRGGYIASWAQYRPGRGRFTPEDYKPGLCTHLFYAFAGFGDDYIVKAQDPSDAVPGTGGFALVNSLKNRDPGLKTLISIGGWSFGKEKFKNMSSSKSTRATFINSAIQFVRRYGSDGIDIDWEYPESETDKHNFSALLRELRDEGGPGLIITAAVAAVEWRIRNGYEVREIAKHLDFVMVMSYDFHGVWEQRTGFNSPLYSQDGLSVHDAATFMASQGMPRSKIVIGIPSYGRGWTLSNSSNAGLGAAAKGPSRAGTYTREEGLASYYEIRDMLASGARRHWDDEQRVPYLVQGDQWFGYDDEESVTEKMQYIKRHGYGGAFVWTLDFDDFNGQSSGGRRYPIMSTIAKELRG